MITSLLYDCDAPGPSTIQDYLELSIVAAKIISLGYQTVLDCLIHGAYIAFLGCVLLLEYVSVIQR